MGDAHGFDDKDELFDVRDQLGAHDLLPREETSSLTGAAIDEL